MAKAHAGPCDYVQSKRGIFEICSKPGCSERFPCAGNTCGHLDCVDVRGKAPNCHLCNKVCAGSRGEEWTSCVLSGMTRAAHYSCRDTAAGPADRVRTGGKF